MRNFIAVFSFAALLTACSDHTPEPEAGPSDVTTIVYMMADNSLSAFAPRDIEEMEHAAGQIPLGSRLVVYVDDAGLPEIFTLGAQTGRTSVARLTEENSCDTAVVERNLRRIITEYPARRYRLVMWSHGTGWVPSARAPRRTIGQDAPTKTEIEVDALGRLLGRLGVHFDYIFFDACFMQCVEADYALRRVADYVVASPAEIPGNGAPYHLIMPQLVGERVDAEGLAQTYYDYYEHGTGLVISVCRTAELDTLRQTTRRLAPDLYTRLQTTQGVQAYGSWSSVIKRPEYYDMGSALHVRLSEADYQAWRRVADRAYPLQLHTASWLANFCSGQITDAAHLTACSVFLPQERYAATLLNDKGRESEWAW